MKFIWDVADFEARQAESLLIEPCHFLLALFKAVDVDVTTVVQDKQSLAERDLVLEELLREVARLRRVFEYAKVNPREFRHQYREIVASPLSTPSQYRLHRSPSSREIFKQSQKLARLHHPEILPTHLLDSLLSIEDANRDSVLNRQNIGAENIRHAVRTELLNISGDQGNKNDWGLN